MDVNEVYKNILKQLEACEQAQQGTQEISTLNLDIDEQQAAETVQLDMVFTALAAHLEDALHNVQKVASLYGEDITITETEQ